MSKPVDIPPEVRNTVLAILRDENKSELGVLIARAILAAKAEERISYRRPLAGHIVILANAMADALGTTRSVLSRRIFGESKKVQLLINGGDLALWRYHDAMQWFADHWPDAVEWPEAAPRPSKSGEV